MKTKVFMVLVAFMGSQMAIFAQGRKKMDRKFGQGTDAENAM